MGTRNITRVILDHQIVVDQYCQWDGYPTGQGENVLQFVKEYCQGDSLEEFKKRLHNSTLFLAKAGKACFTGARPSPVLDKMYRIKYGAVSTPDLWKQCIESGTVTQREVTYFLSASRDTGSDILYWLMAYEPDGMIFYTTDYIYNMKYELDWQIEGMYVINLDEEIVTIDYHGKIMVYTFKEVQAMTEDGIMKEMEDFEKADEEEEN